MAGIEMKWRVATEWLTPEPHALFAVGYSAFITAASNPRGHNLTHSRVRNLAHNLAVRSYKTGGRNRAARTIVHRAGRRSAVRSSAARNRAARNRFVETVAMDRARRRSR